MMVNSHFHSQPYLCYNNAANPSSLLTTVSMLLYPMNVIFVLCSCTVAHLMSLVGYHFPLVDETSWFSIWREYFHGNTIGSC